jgi:hypothetical protein
MEKPLPQKKQNIILLYDADFTFYDPDITFYHQILLL